MLMGATANTRLIRSWATMRQKFSIGTVIRQRTSGRQRLSPKETAYKHSLSSSGSLQSSSGFNASTSVSEIEEDSCPPKEFIGLKNGGKKNDYIVEGILFQSGRLWNRDQRWTVRRFRQ